MKLSDLINLTPEQLKNMNERELDSVQEAIELPKSENAKKELYKTSDFFDEDF